VSVDCTVECTSLPSIRPRALAHPVHLPHLRSIPKIIFLLVGFRFHRVKELVGFPFIILSITGLSGHI
jgi:hypothetical protein